MDYASDSIVTSSELLRFLNDLQSQQHFASIPIVSHASEITREDFLTILYKLFDGKTMEHHSSTISSTQVTEDTKSGYDIPSTLQQTIAQYADEHRNISWTGSSGSALSQAPKVPYTSGSLESSERVGINYEAVQDTLHALQSWIAQL